MLQSLSIAIDTCITMKRWMSIWCQFDVNLTSMDDIKMMSIWCQVDINGWLSKWCQNAILLMCHTDNKKPIYIWYHKNDIKHMCLLHLLMYWFSIDLVLMSIWGDCAHWENSLKRASGPWKRYVLIYTKCWIIHIDSLIMMCNITYRLQNIIV